MENDYSQSNLNALRNLKAAQNQDVNAVAIDSMLANLKILFKKVLILKKTFKEFSQLTISLTEEQVSEKIGWINGQTKNLGLVFDKQIPPNKRMTNLLYMRIVKQISYYDNIIPSFIDILPLLEQSFSQQLKSDNYCIASLYLICEKKFIQEIKAIKKKNIEILEEKNMKFISDKISLQQQLVEKKITSYLHKPTHFQDPNQNLSDSDKLTLLSDTYTDKKQSTKPISCLNEVIQRVNKYDLFTDFKQKAASIFSHIYSPLDIYNIQIVTSFVPTLRPVDNIELIFRKVNLKNKKCKKQIRQYQIQYSLFLHRKRKAIKPDLSRHKVEVSQHKIEKLIVPWPKNLLKMNNKALEQQTQLSTIKNQRKYIVKSIELLKPIPHKQNEKDRSSSRLRQRFQQNLENQKQITTTSHFKPHNLAPIILNQNRGVLQIKLRKKRTIQLDEIHKKSKENDEENSGKQLKREKLRTGNKFQIKFSNKIQRRSRSMKNPSNKQIINKKLRL